MEPTILKSVEDGIAVVSFNRPRVRNAFNHATLRLLALTLDEVASSPEVECVVLTGEGDTFCSGDDLNEAATITDEQHSNILEVVQGLTYQLRAMPKPVIAAIDGYAVGGGLELTFACDIRIATERARFCTPEVTRSLLISNATSSLLPRLIGDGRAREMLFTGRMYDAAWAHRVGLINEIVPDGELRARAVNLARDIVKSASPTLPVTKQLLNAVTQAEVKAAIDGETAALQTTSILDSRDRIQEFLSKTTAAQSGA
ncbi:enoyl-CoA hydratase/isomerase family protein [Dactylosporangium sp. CA-233914]|uniref:enoyl-CoA hydratase/isomerase family protein n=1 Tax=Dactylosporangium sp. CA-233914 TaxID=3239934 RepID=UPI003D8B91A5